MLNSKNLSYSSIKNCFIYLSSLENRNLNLTENDVLEISQENIKFYFSPQFLDSAKSQEIFFLNGLYAKKLGFGDNTKLNVDFIHHESPIASSVTLKPVSSDDWQILELNLESVENTLLDQIKIFFKDQIFPIWIDSDLCVYVKTLSFEPSSSKFTAINSMTRIIIEPFVEPTSSFQNEQNAIQFYKWNDIFQVDFSNEFNVLCDGILNRCTNLTKCEIKGNDTGQMEKFIVSLQPVKSPIQLMNTKESGTVSMRKFINSIESSYQAEYTSLNDSNRVVYAMLDAINFKPNASFSINKKPVLKLSNFLQQKLGLFELNPKVLVKARATSLKECKVLLENTEMKHINLKTNYSGEHQNIKSAFVNFIDQQSECLCPIILTNETLLHLPFQNETIKCLTSLKSDLITISSTTLLNNLLKLDIEIIPAAQLDKFEIDLKHLARNTFNIDLIKPKWFEANLKSILSSLNSSFLPDNSSKNRNIIIQGSSGSGKTTLCKSLCNSLPNTIYFYINCQTFISKTPDTIFDQLKLIYQEALWYENKPCLVILENIDLLVENKSNNTDPSSFLYYSQIVEVLKEILLSVWQSKNICTIVTSSTALSELPSIFHCLDEHGLFTEFYQISPLVEKSQIKEIIELLLEKKNFLFDQEVVEHVTGQCDGFVFKDIEKLIDKIIFSNFGPNCSHVLSLDENLVKLVYNYTPINMIETKFYKSRAELSWDSIGGHEHAKSSLIETLIWPMKYRNLYSKFLMKQSSGVLLYGPSGCGKTLIASAVANESKFNFLSVKGPEILSKYIGNSEQNVRDLFRKAQKAKPCIIFFDEFDSVAPKRGHDSTGVTDRVVNQLLTQLDGIEQLDGVYLLAATSRPDLIDQALLRPGRIDSYLYIDYPTKSELEKIFKIYCANVKVSDDVDWKDVAGYCEFFSGADVKSAICDALIKAFHKAEKEKCEQDIFESIILDKGVLMSSLDSIRDSINLNERKRLKIKYENWKNKKIDNETPKNARLTLA